ncbi:MAG: OpgC domain-containing protein [Proteobacteria bacterium]|nr:OpgC domain-containing protein [Pseudomonadota bacterium]
MSLAPAVAAPSGRNLSVDFWRGIYLLMIYINHIPGQILAALTLRNWGFSDSAEVFVFLSGISSYLAFQKFFVHGGFSTGCLRVAKRIWQLLCAHILLVVGMAGLLAWTNAIWKVGPIIEGYNFLPLLTQPGEAIPRLLTLRYLPNLGDILPLYVVLMAFFPLTWLLMRLTPWLAAGVSLALWFCAGYFNLSLPNFPIDRTWFFNPLAWQVLFVGGILCAAQHKALVAFARKTPVFYTALTILFLSVITVAPWVNIIPQCTFRIVPEAVLILDDKTNVSLIRLLHFACLAIVGVWVLPNRTHRFWARRDVSLMMLCGRHSLPVYISGTILSLLVSTLLILTDYDRIVSLAMVLLGCVLLIAVAGWMEFAKTKLKRP